MSKNVNILPADAYVVLNKTVITDYERRIVSMLYQPIIGYTAISLYFTLIDDLDKSSFVSEEYLHHHLMSIMQLNLDTIVVARKKLEAIGLLKTFIKKDRHINSYIYLLYSPLTAHEFFTHPILNIVLYNNIGKKEYDKLVSYYKSPTYSFKDYDDITSKFFDIFKVSISKNIDSATDVIKSCSSKLEIENQVDFNMLISSLPKSMISDNCFKADVKELINSLAFIYKIDDLNMQGIVRSSINERGLIDKKELRKACRNAFQFENYGKLPTLIYANQPEYLRKELGDTSKWAKMVYTFENISPYEYLKSRYKGAEPTSRDLRLVESLIIDQKMNPGVVNVLLSYVLKINNQKLSKNYVETIAGQWKRLNIETVEDAMKTAEKEHKKMKKIISPKEKTTPKFKEEELPAWFDSKNKKENISKEEELELDEILKELA